MNPRPQPIQVKPTCPHCGNLLTSGGVAFLCSEKGGKNLPLPDYCGDAECRNERDERAIADAIERGLITP
jgi:hypothetical protein